MLDFALATASFLVARSNLSVSNGLSVPEIICSAVIRGTTYFKTVTGC